MDIINEYLQLPFWVKVGVWGAIASIVALAIYLSPLGSYLANLITGSITQEGYVQTKGTGYYEVYYPITYVSQPELTWPKTTNGPDRSDFTVIEQRPDGFRIDVHTWWSGWTDDIHWRAKGTVKR